MKLKVLLSAYACKPGRGSEPGIGWNTARQMAKYHEVWVITRGDNRESIEEELARRPVPDLHFVFFDLPGWQRGRIGNQLHYYLWQLGIYFIARRLYRRERFDLAHHISYVRYWTPSLLALLPIPFIWGPVGGDEVVPLRFRPELGLRARIIERMRDLLARAVPFDPLVRLTARNSTLVLANTDATAARVQALGAREVRVMGEAGLDELALASGTHTRAPEAPVQFATLTRLEYWKGVQLGLRAFARLDDPESIYWIVGEGTELVRLQALARELGVTDRVRFRRNLSRMDWFRILRECDALVHPCLSNTGNMISLEAMAAGRPVICLDIGAITGQVTDDTGFKIRAEDPEQAVEGLTQAMQVVVRDRDGVNRMGQRARERVERYFTWDHRARVLNDLYIEVVRGLRREYAPHPAATAAVDLSL